MQLKYTQKYVYSVILICLMCNGVIVLHLIIQNRVNFCDTLNTYGLVQINAIPSTKHGNILDLVITYTPHLPSNIEECDTSFMSDHVVLSFSIYERFKYTRDTSRLMYSYKHTNVSGLIDDLTNSKLLSTVGYS